MMAILGFENKEDERRMLKLFDIFRQVEQYRFFCLIANEVDGFEKRVAAYKKQIKKLKEQIKDEFTR